MPSLIKKSSSSEKAQRSNAKHVNQPQTYQQTRSSPTRHGPDSTPPRPQINSWLNGTGSDGSASIAHPIARLPGVGSNSQLSGALNSRPGNTSIGSSRRGSQQTDSSHGDTPVKSGNKSGGGILLRGPNLAARGWKGSRSDEIKVPSPVPGSWDDKVLTEAMSKPDVVVGSGIGGIRTDQSHLRREDAPRVIQGRRTTAPRLRYNRTPIRFAVSGDWALKECEVRVNYYNMYIN